MTERSCTWLAGPKDVTVHVSAAKWWFAISRDIFTQTYRSQQARLRPPVACHRTPQFASPLAKRS